MNKKSIFKTVITVCMILIMLVNANYIYSKDNNIKLNRKTISMSVGEKGVIKCNWKVKWKSGNKKVAVILGKKNIRAKKVTVKAISVGKSKITAYIGKYKAVCNIKVMEVAKTNETKEPLHNSTIEPKATTQPSAETPKPTEMPKSTEEPNVTATPDPTPVHVTADAWLLFSVEQEIITTDTKYISGILDFSGYDSVVKVIVDGKQVASKEFLNDEKTYNIEVDFSNYKEGCQVVVSRKYLGDNALNGSLYVWDQHKQFILQSGKWKK